LSVPPPGPGFGDSIGAMTIAGGIMGALFHRERTGQTTVVDVSLLGAGMWAMGQSIALSQVLDMPISAPPQDRMGGNPLVQTYLTQDGRGLALTCLQGGKYWPQMCEIVGRPELATDERFATHEALLANGKEATGILKEVFAGATLDQWRERLDTFAGQWAVVQNTLEVAADPQSVANGYVQDCTTADGHPFRLVTVPVQYDEAPAEPHRAPEFNEHGDEILTDLGLDMDAIIDLRVRGVVA
jgi:crotonobetainyl-CoA:carnitine CoA-transferase CaiB-like acyl-CoA transferase